MSASSSVSYAFPTWSAQHVKLSINQATAHIVSEYLANCTAMAQAAISGLPAGTPYANVVDPYLITAAELPDFIDSVRTSLEQP